ncbi:MAG: glycosyltransferase family 1 protein [Salinarimonadaceae bacterium]|nr:MAG: glycosyltransferase family 1 protein [Salinarimonadaceae bacterium]
MDKPPKRILHVFRSPIGGLFRHVLDLAREQAVRGCEVGLFFDSLTENARTGQLLEEVAPHLALGITRTPMKREPGLGDIRALRMLARLQRKVEAHVLHGHGSKGGAYARGLSRSARAGAVTAYTPHGGSFHFKPGDLRHHLYMAAERFLGRRTDVFLFESRYVARCFEEFVGQSDRPAFIVHNGLHPHEFEPVEPAAERFDLLFIGEMLLAKGVDTLLEALAMIRERRGDAPTLLAVGSGPDRERIEEMARALGIADTVVFEGPQPIRAALSRARVMAMPSRAESLPYVVLEAAAAGRPIVATNVGGVPEILAPVAGDLIAPGDAPALARALLARLGEQDVDANERAERVRDYLRDNFSVARMTDAVLAGYEAGATRRRMTR